MNSAEPFRKMTAESTLLAAMLEPLAGACRVETPYWMEISDEEGDEYCWGCGLIKQNEELALRGIKLRDEWDYSSIPRDLLLNRGDYSETDSPGLCVTCGVTLNVCLTDAGADSEFAHFFAQGIEIDSPECCYALHDALDNVTWIAESEGGDRDNNLPIFEKLRMQVEEKLFQKYGGFPNWIQNTA